MICRASSIHILVLAPILACLAIAPHDAHGARLIAFADEQQGWMVGFGARVLHTQDGGMSWRQQSTPSAAALHAICFVDAEQGWAVGDGGAMLRTTDGGSHWRACESPTNARLRDVFFVDARHGWAVGQVPAMLSTRDGGLTWRKLPVDPVATDLTGVCFARYVHGKPTFGLVVGTGGGIYRTRDGGRNWLRKYVTGTPLGGVVAVHSHDGPDRIFNFAAGAGGTFLTCYDHNFDPRILDAQPDLNALAFADEQVGWVVADAGRILHTQDSGLAWQQQNVHAVDLEAVDCAGTKHVWVLSKPVDRQGDRASQRHLFRSRDGGLSWQEQLLPETTEAGPTPASWRPPVSEAFAPDAPFRIFVPRTHPISNRFILPHTRFSEEAAVRELQVTACPGEYEPATFAIRSSVALRAVSVHVADLRGPDERPATIPADAVDVCWVKCWHQRRGGLMSELLLKDDGLVPPGSSEEPPSTSLEQLADSDRLEPLDLPAGFTKQVWLTVCVPGATPPGQYVGVVTVSADGHEQRQLHLRVSVLPFSLADPMLDYGIYVNTEIHSEPILACRLYDRSIQQTRALMANLRAHGITHPFIPQPIAVRPVPKRRPGELPWQQIQYDTTALRRYLEILDELGYPKDKLYWGIDYMMMGINYSKREKVGDPNIRKWPAEAYMPTLNAVTALAKEFGYGAVYFAGMDEVSREQLAYQGKLFDLMRRADTPVPARTWSAAGAPTDVYDATNCSHFPDRRELREFTAAGRLVNIYANPVSGVEQPYTFRRNVGLLLYLAGVTGTGWWADYYTSERRDFSFVYYTRNGQIDTLQWQGWREGCDDVRYLTTLRQAMASARREGDQRTSGALAASADWLANLRIADDAQDVREGAIAHILALE